MKKEQWTNDVRQLKKGHHFADGDNWKRSSVFYQEKIGTTPSVTAPGLVLGF